MADFLRRFLVWADDLGVPPRGAPHFRACGRVGNMYMHIIDQTTRARPAPLTPAWLRLITKAIQSTGQKSHCVRTL